MLVGLSLSIKKRKKNGPPAGGPSVTQCFFVFAKDGNQPSSASAVSAAAAVAAESLLILCGLVWFLIADE